MDPRVEEYLRKCEEQKKEEEAAYREKVLIAAGLTNKQDVECSEEEFYNTPMPDRGPSQELDDGWHYHILKKEPIEVTDEEFAAIEKTIIANEKKEVPAFPESMEQSWAGSFFTGLAWFIWIGGLIASIVLAIQTVPSSGYYGRTTNETQFSFSTFLTFFSTCFFAGAFCMAAAEHFKKLQTIVNLLRGKK